MLIIFTLITHVSFANEIVMARPQSDSDATHTYYVGLIKLALTKINKLNDYTITFSTTVLTQGRTIIELEKKDGKINIYQSGTSIEREQKLIPIRIPLLKGSLGYRIGIIHKDNIDKFDQVSSLKDLQKLVACQGEHWPDSDILENANLPVIRNANFKSMFLQTKRKYCDYFPRAIIEAYSEILAHQDETNELVAYDKLVISYPFPMYFFVSPHHPQLAKDIESGLKKAIADGSFDDYFKTSKITKHIFPLSKWKKSTVIQLENKKLPKNTPLNNPSLWLPLDSK